MCKAILEKVGFDTDTIVEDEMSSARPRNRLAVPSVTMSEGTLSLTMNTAFSTPHPSAASSAMTHDKNTFTW